MISLYKVENTKFKDDEAYLSAELRGLSTDEKPTETTYGKIDNGSIYLEIDTGKIYLYDLENEKDDTYKDLVDNEIIFIRRNKDKIYKNVELIYKQKAENDISAGYVKSALNYKELEKLCDKYLIKDE